MGLMSTEAVQLAGVSKSYRDHVAVRALDLSVPQGCIYGFIGPNGSGKTTTIRMILHIIQPDEGLIRVLGKASERAANDEIGYLPEERGLYRKMSVARLLEYYASIKGLSRGDARRETDRWLERMGLMDWKKRKVEALSKGMAQKVQFISAAIARPRLLILDEPFSGLDPVNLEVIREAVLDLNRQGTSIIFSTHDMMAAERMCDFVFMIHNGCKVLDGSLDAVRDEHGSDMIRIRLAEGVAGLKNLEGVALLRDLGRVQEIRVDEAPRRFLERLARQRGVEHFEIAKPSLHDIFVRIAGEEDAA